MTSTDATRLAFAELRRSLDERSLSSLSLTQSVLARIDRLDGELRTYVDLDRDGALAQAEKADDELDAGTGRGPLHGIPIGIKESFGVEGRRFGGGGYPFRSLRAERDAAVVARAREGGAVILGMHAMSENAMGTMVVDGERATGRNPRHPDFAPGGSSSGTAAATAAGLCVVGLGADGGGSVRNPAAACGVVGFKPTEHRLPKEGCHPWTVTMLTAGTFAADVEGAARAFDVLAATSSPLGRAEPPCLGVVGASDLGQLDDEVGAAMSEATESFRAAGATILDVPPIDLAVGDAWLSRMREFAHAHALPLMTSGEGYSEGMRQMIEGFASVPTDAYVASFAAADRLRVEVDAALEDCDVLLLPANPWPAVRWEDWAGPETFDWYRFSWPFNLSWHPGITVPWTLARNGLPISFQLIGRCDQDEGLLGVAAWCERQSEFDRAPVPA
ncbi:MAG: amidase [Gaiellaceae bacterium]